MTNFVKTAIATIAAATAFMGTAAAEQANHSQEMTPVLILNDLNSVVEAKLAASTNSKIENMVAAASADFATIPAYTPAELNSVVAATTKETSQTLAAVMNDQITDLVANGPKASSFQVALND